MAMKLSLSTRVAESPGQKEIALVGLPDLVGMARNAGYHALCMRASQVGVQHSSAEQTAARQTAADLAVSMVTGDFDIPVNNDRAQMALRNITPHLDLAENLGSDLIRIGMKAATDIEWAKSASDEAAERGIRLAHQCHTCTLFETVSMSVEILRQVDRPNFGVIYEPANLLVCGQDYGRATLEALQPWLMNVYLQNMRVHDEGRQVIETWINGPVKFDLVPFGHPAGIDYRPILEDLSELGYAEIRDGPPQRRRRDGRRGGRPFICDVPAGAGGLRTGSRTLIDRRPIERAFPGTPFRGLFTGGRTIVYL